MRNLVGHSSGTSGSRSIIPRCTSVARCKPSPPLLRRGLMLDASDDGDPAFTLAADFGLYPLHDPPGRLRSFRQLIEGLKLLLGFRTIWRRAPAQRRARKFDLDIGARC